MSGFFFFNDTATTEIYTLSLHDALPITHQWFGDLTTMRWFDDLWLKEGFAQYMAFHALASLKPSENIWKRFYQSIKPAAYSIDSTKGTTPIYQNIANLQDAKSAYGAVVYSRLREASSRLALELGEEDFRVTLALILGEIPTPKPSRADLCIPSCP